MPQSDTGIELLAARLRQAAYMPFEEHDEGEQAGTRHWSMPNPELNVVPLVDVLFLLMIFFVIAGTFGLSEGVLTSRMSLGGKGGWGTRLPISPVVVEVRAAKDQVREFCVRLGPGCRELHTTEELTAELKRVFEMPGFGGFTPIVIRAEDHASWDDVIAGWNAILLSGFQDVAFGAS